VHPPNSSFSMSLGESRNARSKGVRSRKAHKGLEWFRPPERKTLRPLYVVLLVSMWKACESLSVSGTSQGLRELK
jgi:hypothetical protein